MSHPNPTSTPDAPPADTGASAGTTETSTETPAPSAPSTPEPSTPAAPAEDVTGLKNAVKAARADADKATKALAELQRKHMTDQERAVDEAKQAGMAEASKTFGARLAAAEFRSAAAEAGADTAGVLDLIDMTRFIRADGEVDSKAITKAVAGLPKLAAASPPPPGAPPTPPRTGGDHRGGTGAGAPLTREQLKAMTPEEIHAARTEGRLNHLL